MTSLPFGQTNISDANLQPLIDTETAIQEAAKGNVENAEEQINQFISSIPALLEWLEEHGRVYPWRKSTDDWEIYVTEILLQRTRGDAVEDVYTEFLQRFPGPKSLAEAPEEEIQGAVRSLGFVNHRTRTLKEVGKLFASEFDSEVPETLEDLKRPWRVGDYSARACQVFARGEPIALVDSNFARVFGRVFGYDMPRQPHKSKRVYALLDALIPSDSDIARAFNLAILDLGALVCTSSNPGCESCPINGCCTYYSENKET